MDCDSSFLLSLLCVRVYSCFFRVSSIRTTLPELNWLIDLLIERESTWLLAVSMFLLVLNGRCCRSNTSLTTADRCVPTISLQYGATPHVFTDVTGCCCRWCCWCCHANMISNIYYLRWRAPVYPSISRPFLRRMLLLRASISGSVAYITGGDRPRGMGDGLRSPDPQHHLLKIMLFLVFWGTTPWGRPKATWSLHRAQIMVMIGEVTPEKCLLIFFVLLW